jgi:hypothetical protein
MDLISFCVRNRCGRDSGKLMVLFCWVGFEVINAWAREWRNVAWYGTKANSDSLVF